MAEVTSPRSSPSAALWVAVAGLLALGDLTAFAQDALVFELILENYSNTSAEVAVDWENERVVACPQTGVHCQALQFTEASSREALSGSSLEVMGWLTRQTPSVTPIDRTGTSVPGEVRDVCDYLWVLIRRTLRTENLHQIRLQPA